MSEWTAYEISILERMWRDGHSCSEIARVLPGRTRNSVIGKIHREGISELVGRPAGTPKRPSTAKQRAARAKVSEARVRTHKMTKPGKLRAVGYDYKENPETAAKGREKRRKEGMSAIQRVDSGAGVVSLNARPFGEATGCKWPLEGGLFCCNPIARGVYCEGHSKVIFVGRGGNITVRGFDDVQEDPKQKPVMIRTPWDSGRQAA